jgi:uncharacterized phage protein (TIGR01671 family)
MTMRELKFRAWDGKYMVRVYGLFPERGSVTTSRKINTEDGHYSITKKYLISNISLMQFIEARDKNGTEIYEGDIVKIFDHLGREEIKEVSYDAPCFKLVGYSNQVRTWHWSAEVIGNIYENPEMMK